MAATGVIDAPTVEKIVSEIRRRGPDNLGMAWLDRDDFWEIKRYKTPSWPEGFGLDTYGYKAAIAHARLATAGSTDPKDAQPIRVGDLVFAHNGTIYKHRDVADWLGIDLTTDNDSEILARLFLANDCNAQRTLQALDHYQTGRSPHAWIAARGRKMWIAAFGQPVYILKSGHAARYASSWRLPEATELPSGTVLEWNI